MKTAASVLTAAAALIGATSAEAQTPTGVWFVGGSVSESSSAYAGGVVALPGGQLGRGLAIRGSANAGQYEYDAGAARIDADYVGGEVALVYQTSGEWGWANVSAGPRFTHTDLSPDDPGNDRRGSRWDLGLLVDGARDGATWRIGWYGSLGPFDGAYQARMQIGRKFDGGALRVGVEGGVQGDPSYTKAMLGAFVATSIAPSLELQIGGGATEQAGRGPRAYGTIGLSRVF